jgi:mono/diheme cytochrome c family protein
MLNRKPPEKSISRQHAPYPFDKDDVKGANTLKSPLPTLTKEEILKLEKVGKKKYEIYCGICHGNKGLGNGSIAEKMLKRPPSLVDSTYKSYSEGRLFHVVTKGWGLMGGYASQIPEENERWAIVNHIRSLQQEQDSKEGE